MALASPARAEAVDGVDGGSEGEGEMEQYPLITALIEAGAVIEFEGYSFDEIETGFEYSLNGEVVHEGTPLIHELYAADDVDALVWETLTEESGYHHMRLVEFHTGD